MMAAPTQAHAKRITPGLLLKIAVSLAFVIALCHWIDPRDMAARLRGIAWAPFAAAAAVNLVLQIVNAIKIRAFFPHPRPRLFGLVSANYIAVFFSSFTPGGMGGEVARWAYLGRESGSSSRAMAAVLLDRITGLWAQILVSLAAWIWIGRGHLSLFIAAPVAATALALSLWAGLWGYPIVIALLQKAAAWYARRSGKAGLEPERLREALADLLAARSRFLKVAVISIFYHAWVVASFVLIDRSLGGSLSWPQAVLFLFLYSLVVFLPIALGNWGLSEGTLGALYRYSGSASAAGVLMSLMLRVMNAPAILVGWIFFLMRGRAAAESVPTSIRPDGLESAR